MRMSMRRLIPAAFLFVEGLGNAIWVAGLVVALQGYGAVAVALVLARGLAGALQCSSGWMLLAGRPPGAVLGQAAFGFSAALAIFETGLRLAPSNADPTYRWLWVGVYWTYALAMILLIRSGRHDDGE